MPLACLVTILFLARQDIGPIDFQAGNFEAELGAILEVVVDVSVVQQNLGGNAAHVKTSAPEEGVLFDDYCFEAEFAGADGGNVAARTTANDCNDHISPRQISLRNESKPDHDKWLESL